MQHRKLTQDLCLLKNAVSEFQSSQIRQLQQPGKADTLLFPAGSVTVIDQRFAGSLTGKANGLRKILCCKDPEMQRLSGHLIEPSRFAQGCGYFLPEIIGRDHDHALCLCERPCLHGFPCRTDGKDHGLVIIVVSLLRRDAEILPENINDLVNGSFGALNLECLDDTAAEIGLCIGVGADAAACIDLSQQRDLPAACLQRLYFAEPIDPPRLHLIAAADCTEQIVFSVLVYHFIGIDRDRLRIDAFRRQVRTVCHVIAADLPVFRNCALDFFNGDKDGMLHTFARLVSADLLPADIFLQFGRAECSQCLDDLIGGDRRQEIGIQDAVQQKAQLAVTQLMAVIIDALRLILNDREAGIFQ